MIVFCVSAMLAEAPFSATSKMTPSARAEQRLWQAIEEGQADKVKLLLQPAKLTREKVIGSVGSAYMSSNEDVAAKKLDQIKFLIDSGIANMKGAAGMELLRAAMRHHEIDERRRLVLAKLAFEHGATANELMLSECKACNTAGDFIPLLIKHGADINRASDSAPSLFEQKVNADVFWAAKKLLALGADPNGGVYAGRGMLARIAASCDVHQMRAHASATDNLEQDRAARCMDSTVRRASFAIQHGADANGKTIPEQSCSTPVEIAETYGNQKLVQALLELGARPDFGNACRKAATSGGHSGGQV